MRNIGAGSVYVIRVELVMWNKLIGVFAVVFCLLLLVPSADASTVGRAVAAIGDNPDTMSVGSTEIRAALGATPAIKYYIPLGNADGVYGVGDFGTSSDFGNGGGVLTMILAFSPVDISKPGLLTILFEDLDLKNANDPFGFFESVQILDASNAALTGVITDIGGLISGDANTQQLLSLSLATLMVDSFYLQLKFNASFTDYGRNTPEYLIARISAVPLPAAFPLFGTGLGLLGFAAWRRRRKRTQTA